MRRHLMVFASMFIVALLAMVIISTLYSETTKANSGNCGECTQRAAENHSACLAKVSSKTCNSKFELAREK